MKILRQLCAATILSLMLAVSAFAGHIETPAAPVPPPGTAPAPTSASSVTSSLLLTFLFLIGR